MPVDSPYQRRSVVLLLAAVAVVGSNSLSFGPIAPDIAQDFERSVNSVLQAAAAYGLGTAFSAYFLARYIDRIGLRRMAESRPDSGSHFFTTRHFPMLALAMLVVVYLVLGLVSTSYVLLIAGAFFWGLVNHLALNILVAALNAADPERRGTIMGLYSCVTYLSLSAGTLFYALFYNGTSLLLLCMVSALICLIAAIAGFFLTNRAYAAITTGN